jgi:hypothetical protein
MKITDEKTYRQALERAAQLRAGGTSAETDAELAEIEAAVAGYEARPDEPDVAKGRPTPDPYGQ